MYFSRNVTFVTQLLVGRLKLAFIALRAICGCFPLVHRGSNVVISRHGRLFCSKNWILPGSTPTHSGSDTVIMQHTLGSSIYPAHHTTETVFFFLNLHHLWFTVPGYLRQCPNLLPCIENNAPELGGLDLGFYIMDRDAACVENCSLLSAFVCNMKNLRRLARGSLAPSDKAILHLASLPPLRFLQTPNTVDDIVRSIKAHRHLEQPFPTLRRFSGAMAI